ncbi:cation diffusion facilitator family transporter [Desulfobotulus sp.]|jgi:cation diffusion facilitator family transporter|uniref:cation diffusion facilitator family transporter n=1 Tax=Desulfobotulus sp. TaxID=1940337 RepID=UPI002A371ABF|nr:cation diffusion facilitator family transporter [Desulfobotulus sp.]MDY0163585.1 cation diffusion facilitator family transporter [Desulfobotulus sp.]
MESKKTDTIRYVTFVGLLINFFLVAIKYAAGWWGNSDALTADALHSATDAITDIILIVGAGLWSKPPDSEHPYGHQRIETLVTLTIGGLLIAAAIGIAIDAIQKIIAGIRCEPLPIAAYAAVISIFTKEALYRWTYKVGLTVKSPAMIANAWHHRTDALSSIPAFFAVSTAIIFPSLFFVDSIGALIVAIFILHASIKILWSPIKEIMDTAAPPEIHQKISMCTLEHPEVLDVHNIRTRFLGTEILADMHLVVDQYLTIKKAHDIAEEVQKKLINQNFGLKEVIIHIEPQKEQATPTSKNNVSLSFQKNQTARTQPFSNHSGE